VTAPLDLLLRGCRLPDGRVADIGCRAGRIVAIGPLAGHPAAREIVCEGRAVTPGLVDAHIHLDKALTAERARENPTNVFEESVAIMREVTIEEPHHG